MLFSIMFLKIRALKAFNFNSFVIFTPKKIIINYIYNKKIKEIILNKNILT